jgi:ribonuclease G
MQKEIYVCVTKEETKAAVLENRKLVEVYLDRSFQKRLAGNIYKGKVANVLPGMQAAFVNIGLERNAFLYVEDARPNKSKSLPIQNMLREGQDVLVQVIKEPFGNKGARVTSHLNFPGRHEFRRQCRSIETDDPDAGDPDGFQHDCLYGNHRIYRVSGAACLSFPRRLG